MLGTKAFQQRAERRMPKIDPAILVRLYVDEQLSIRRISDQLHIAPRTVHDALIRNRIPRREAWQRVPAPGAAGAGQSPLDATLLQQLYVDEQRSLGEIAQIVGVCATTVYKALVRFGIPRRARGRPHKPAPRDPA